MTTLELAKFNRIRKVKDLRDTKMYGGFTHNNTVWDSDERAQTNIIGAVTAIGAMVPFPENFSWRDKENNNHPMDVEDLRALGAALMMHVNTCYVVSWTHKNGINACETIQEVENYDIEAGW